jgi:tRNA(Ile)-lysidine synthase
LSLADSFRRKVRAAAEVLLIPETACLMAVSGGPDSVALAAELTELAPDLAVEPAMAHLDHGIRAESASDAEWVASLAERLELPFMSERADVPALRRNGKLTLEEAARRERYAFLERAALEWGASFVTTGHTADDQAETVLFRIIRGTGLAGLAGMPVCRPISADAAHVMLVRPMLECTREEVLVYLEERGLDFLTDETNFDVEAQARARLRHELLPRLAEDHNPEVRAAVLRLAESAREAQEALAELAARQVGGAGDWIREDGGELRLPLSLLQAPQALRVEILGMLCSRVQTAHHLDRSRLAEAARELPDAQVGKRFELGDLLAVRDYEHVVLRHPGEEHPGPGPWEVPVEVPGETRVPVGTLRAERILACELDMDEYSLTKTAYEEVFDARLLDGGGEVRCRTRHPGDRFRPLGVAGERKLKDFFIDEKIPQAHRDAVPLLMLGEEILWVVGYRLSERARVTADAQELIRLEFVPARN